MQHGAPQLSYKINGLIHYTIMATAQDLLPIIRQVIREEITPRLDSLEQKINEIALLRKSVQNNEKRLDDHERSIAFNDNLLKNITDNTIPDLEKKFDELTEEICFKILNINTHRRKWSLMISGLEGQANEREVNTKSKLKKFAVESLKVTDAISHPMAACHRLSNEANSAIIAKFVNLDDRNTWLSCAKNLKGKGTSVSISPDLPPALRPLKTDIMKQRKEIMTNDKIAAKVKYHPVWPYISLSAKGKPKILPRITKKNIISKYLGLD